MFSFAGDVVLDPFVGSGTTMLAAMHLGRSSIGIDVDSSYLAHAARRLAAHAPAQGPSIRRLFEEGQDVATAPTRTAHRRYKSKIRA